MANPSNSQKADEIFSLFLSIPSIKDRMDIIKKMQNSLSRELPSSGNIMDTSI